MPLLTLSLRLCISRDLTRGLSSVFCLSVVTRPQMAHEVPIVLQTNPAIAGDLSSRPPPALIPVVQAPHSFLPTAFTLPASAPSTSTWPTVPVTAPQLLPPSHTVQPAVSAAMLLSPASSSAPPTQPSFQDIMGAVRQALGIAPQTSLGVAQTTTPSMVAGLPPPIPPLMSTAPFGSSVPPQGTYTLSCTSLFTPP